MKRLVKIVSIILALWLVTLTCVANVTYKMTLEFDRTPEKFTGFSKSSKTKEWFMQNKSDQYIYSEDGLKLHAFEIKNTGSNSNGNYAIICHGYTDKAATMVNSIKRFYDMGYSILAPDARAHGESEGKVCGMGWLERRDIVKWANYINETNSNTKIVLYGVSMGGATVMMTSGEADLPTNVFAVVEDCGFSSVWDEFSDFTKRTYHLPSFPIINFCSLVTKIRGGYSFRKASSVEQVKKSRTPTLFIHGTNDRFVEFYMLEKVYEAASCEKEKLEVEGAGHADSASHNPELYWSTVETFLEKYAA